MQQGAYLRLFCMIALVLLGFTLQISYRNHVENIDVLHAE